MEFALKPSDLFGYDFLKVAGVTIKWRGPLMRTLRSTFTYENIPPVNSMG